MDDAGVDRLEIGPIEVTRRSWLTLLITSAVGFMVSLEITVIALAFPEIRTAFPTTSEATLSWIITGYSIGLAALLLLAGWASDRYGHKRLFLIGLTIFAAASLVAGLAPTVGVLIAARLIQSIGGAMQFPSGLALLLAAFPIDRRQVAIGVWGAMGGLAAAAGPPLGGFLVGVFGWRAVFLINVPIAVAAAIGGFLWLSESRHRSASGRVDMVSIPLGTIGVGLIVLTIVQGPEWGWLDNRTVLLFLAGLALVGLFVARSSRHPHPLFALELFGHRSYTLGNVGSVFFVVAFFSYFVPLPTYIQDVWGWSAIKTGLVVVPGPLVAAVLSPVSGRIADRHGVAPVLTVGGLAGALALTLHLLFTAEEPNPVLGIIVPGLVLGVSAGCSFAMLVGATMRDVPPDRYGMAGAGRTTVFQLSIALAIAVAVAVIGRPETAGAHLDGLQLVWVIGLALFLGQAAVFGLAFPRDQRA